MDNNNIINNNINNNNNINDNNIDNYYNNIQNTINMCKMQLIKNMQNKICLLYIIVVFLFVTIVSQLLMYNKLKVYNKLIYNNYLQEHNKYLQKNKEYQQILEAYKKIKYNIQNMPNVYYQIRMSVANINYMDNFDSKYVDLMYHSEEHKQILYRTTKNIDKYLRLKRHNIRNVVSVGYSSYITNLCKNDYIYKIHTLQLFIKNAIIPFIKENSNKTEEDIVKENSFMQLQTFNEDNEISNNNDQNIYVRFLNQLQNVYKEIYEIYKQNIDNIAIYMAYRHDGHRQQIYSHDKYERLVINMLDKINKIMQTFKRTEEAQKVCNSDQMNQSQYINNRGSFCLDINEDNNCNISNTIDNIQYAITNAEYLCLKEPIDSAPNINETINNDFEVDTTIDQINKFI